MGKKKTTFVWILLVLVAIWLLSSAINVITSLVNINILLTPAPLSNPAINIINLILIIIGLVLTAIFFVKLYNVRPDVIKWVNIAFGFVIFITIVRFILTMFVAGFLALIASPMLVVVLIFEVLMWVGISKHLKRAQREKLMDFS
jgi:hypothetical protein